MGVGELQGISTEKNLNKHHIYHNRTREERIYSSSILVIIVTSLLEIAENATQLDTSSRNFAVLAFVSRTSGTPTHPFITFHSKRRGGGVSTSPSEEKPQTETTKKTGSERTNSEFSGFPTQSPAVRLMSLRGAWYLGFGIRASGFRPSKTIER